MSENMASAKAEDQEKTGQKNRREKRSSVTDDPSLNLDEIRELAALVDEHGFTDFEFENENIRVRLSRQVAAVAPTYQPPPHQAPPPASAPAEAGPAAPASEAEDLFKIPSPIVGTFYRAAGPDKEPYVKEGSAVTPETIVCIVEAMKLMNEIQAETTGEVVEIYVENGQPVEYGQPLFGIRK